MFLFYIFDSLDVLDFVSDNFGLQVTDDVVDCVTVEDEKCEDETVGYTTQTKCEKWPR